MEPWERIEAVIKYLKLNNTSFSKEIGLSNNVTISRIIREKRKASNKVLRLIVARFPSISYDWLLTGQGEMFLPEMGKPSFGLAEDNEFSKDNNVHKEVSGERLYRAVQYDNLVDALKTLVDTNRELVETNKKLVQLLAKGMKNQ